MEELNETVETIEIVEPVEEEIEEVDEPGSGSGIGILVGVGVAALGVFAFKKLKPIVAKGAEKVANRLGYYKMTKGGETVEVEVEVVDA